MKWLKSIYESEFNKPYHLISETEAELWQQPSSVLNAEDQLKKWSSRELVRLLNTKSLKPEEVVSETKFIWAFAKINYLSRGSTIYTREISIEEPSTTDDASTVELKKKENQDLIDQKLRKVDIYKIQRKIEIYRNAEFEYSQIEFDITKTEDDWFILHNWMTPYKRSDGSAYKCDGIRGLLAYLSDNGFIQK